MAKTTFIWTTQVTDEPADATSGNSAGHRLVMTITEASSIELDAFVFQRAPVTPGSTDFEDAFYSVASVVDMADLAVSTPADGSVFYRARSLDLFFGSIEELDEAIDSIETAIGALALANDTAIRLASATTSCFPADSCERYWGVSASSTLTDEQILALDHEPGLTIATSKVMNTDGTKYLYMAYRANLGAGTFTLDGNAVAMTLVTRDVVNENGHTASYRIYRTTSTQTGAALTLAVTS
jgi:hypothetical protein